MKRFPSKRYLDGARYWWFRLAVTGYVPDLFRLLNGRERRALKRWYAWTDKSQSGIGESNIPVTSLLVALINGNGMRRVAQLGHYTGFSSLFIASAFRRMGGGQLFSLDIDNWATKKANKLVKSAGLADYLTHYVGDSSSQTSLEAAKEALETIDLIYIDSDHTYKHAMKELILWWPALRPGGLLVMHDSSSFATSFGIVPDSGVKAAVEEFFGKEGLKYLNINSEVAEGYQVEALTYVDGCGALIAQKPFANS